VADIGLELPELQLLHSRLQQGDALQEQLDDVLGASGQERANINALKALQQHASSCGLALIGAFKFWLDVRESTCSICGGGKASMLQLYQHYVIDCALRLCMPLCINALKALQQHASSCGLALIGASKFWLDVREPRCSNCGGGKASMLQLYQHYVINCALRLCMPLCITALKLLQ
jgi:ribosomal protein L37E